MGSVSLVKRGEQSSLDREQSLALTSSKCSSPRTSTAASGHGGQGGEDRGETVGQFKTFCNIFISFVGACRRLLLLPARRNTPGADGRGGTHAGAGVLGLPYAFRKSGLVLGAGFLILTAALSLHCMLLLVRCKKHLVRHVAAFPERLNSAG
jgi:hypothetical protein